MLLIAVLVLLVCNISAANTISFENSLPGTDEWYRGNGNEDRSIAVEGFTTKASYYPGEVVHFKLSSKPSSIDYKIVIHRLGYYNGIGARRVGTINMRKSSNKSNESASDTFTIRKQPACLFDELTRVTDCSNWQTTAHWTIPADAVSGVYTAQPLRHPPRTYHGSYIPIIVKRVLKPGATVDMLFKTSDMTWQAYNRYGDYNVYRGTNESFADQGTRAYKASYNRPYRNRVDLPFGHSINFIFGAELPMIFWLEKHGYDVSYCASQDVETMHQDGTLLNYKTILSVGHDEYWTGAMKAAHEYARDHGVHLAFFSGNEVFWRVMWDEDTQKSKEQGGAFAVGTSAGQKVPLEPRRVFVCRKETLDSVPSATPEEWTGTFRDPRFRPADLESLLTGQDFMVNGDRNDSLTVTVEDAQLRFWRHATFHQSPQPPPVHVPPQQSKLQSMFAATPRKVKNPIVYRSENGLLGYEWDAFPMHGGRHPGLIPLSTTTMKIEEKLIQDFGASYYGSGQATHRMSLYRRYNYAPSVTRDSWTFESACAVPVESRKVQPQSTSLVFGAGTVQWSWGLSDRHDERGMRPDRDIQQATLNLFADMGVFPGSFVADMTPPLVSLVLPVTSTDTFPPSSSITAAQQKTASGKVARSKVVVEVRGTAQDDERGGGTVAAVEVSADGGRTWAMATGRSQWKHTFVLNKVAPPVPHYRQFNTSNVGSGSHDAVRWLRKSLLQGKGMYCTAQLGLSWGGAKQQCGLLILSRAIDDSGWIEHADTLAGLCALKAEPQSSTGDWKVTQNVRVVQVVV